MDNSFFAYLQQLELMAFFSGYPLIYAVILVFAGNREGGNDFKRRVVMLLPFAYALVGTLYLGLQLKNLYPDYSAEHIRLTFTQPYLQLWGLLSILFWIPALGKKAALTLIHSLVFFFFLVRDLSLQFSGSSSDKSFVRNDMNIYTISLLLNFGTLAIAVLVSYLFIPYNKRLGS